MFHVKQFKNFDVLVVGAGHAGVEAAVMASRMGAKTAMVTFSKDDIGRLSCNPAMGGLGKGHLIREIDAIGGIIGQVSDLAGIQFRMLNKTRGEAVQGPRAQIDRNLYKQNLLNLLEKEKISLLYDEVLNIKLRSSANNKNVEALELQSLGKIYCKSAIITTGTFLRGIIHQGGNNWSAGRINSKPSIKLASFFKSNNFKTMRLKTGTPPRLFANSIDFSKCQKQYGDDNPEPFSFLNDKIKTKQICCHITHTNEKTHEVVKRNIRKSPMFNGQIKSKGPRYCPSLEDKVYRFKDKKSHQIFLEPETLENKIIYPNGISTSLPVEVQKSFLKSIVGLENVKIDQFGYSIEYDCIDSSELQHSLETKKINGLFLAGQINGTTGYEEAAAQGLVAGINAARKISKKEPVIFKREEGYIGVMVSDLCRGGLIEPYRMFTSRAEYRLLLRADNADERLSDLGINLNVACKTRKKKWLDKKRIINKANKLLHALSASPQQYSKFGIKINMDGRKRSAYEIIGYKDVSWEMLRKMWPKIRALNISTRTQQQIKANSFYQRYSSKQQQEIDDLENDRMIRLGDKINYTKCAGLSNEVKEILSRHKPQNIAQARVLPGMTPAAASILLRFAKK